MSGLVFLQQKPSAAIIYSATHHRTLEAFFWFCSFFLIIISSAACQSCTRGNENLSHEIKNEYIASQIVLAHLTALILDVFVIQKKEPEGMRDFIVETNK